MKGFVVEIPLFDRETKLPVRDANNQIRLIPAIRTVDGKEYKLFRDEILTDGLGSLAPGQIVEFEANGRVARRVRRVPTRESKRWRQTAEIIETQNGKSGFVSASVISYNPKRGYGFLETTGTGKPREEVFFHIKAFIRRDHEDRFIQFYDDDSLMVKVERGAGNGKAPRALQVICLEKTDRI